ncbi:MAG: hypothetical protein U0905_06090 [Pirellulales bacterium]
MKHDELKWKSPILCALFLFGPSDCERLQFIENSKWFEHQALKDRSIALLEKQAEQDKEGKQLQEARQGFEQLTFAKSWGQCSLTLLARLHIDPIDGG